MQRRKICRYFQRGSCKKDNCPFVHLKQNRKTCNFYMEGNCRKGTSCNFYHPPREQQKLAKLKQQLKNKTKQQKLKPKQKQEQSSQSEKQQKQKEELKQQHEYQIHRKEEQGEKQFQKIDDVSQHSEEELEKEETNHQEVQKIQTSQKVNKINFLLGLNQSDKSEFDDEQQEVKIQQEPQSMIQFVKTYPKKFIDYNKTPEMKQQIKQNEAKYFKGAKFLDLIAKAIDPKQKEYLQIVRKYTDHFSSSENEPYHFSVKIRPLLYQKEMQTHFEFLQNTLDLDIDANKYPEERAVITIINKSIPQQYKQKFLYFILKYHQSKTLLQTLKFIQNTFQKIYKESHFKLQNQFYSRKELQKKLKNQINNKSDESNDSKQPGTKKVRVKTQKYKNPFVIQIKYKQQEKKQNLNYMYQLTSQSIIMQNCEYVLIQKALLYLECVCQQKIMYILDGCDDKALQIALKLQCRKCQNIISLGLERTVIQARRQNLGKIAVNGGHLVDLGGLSFKIGCVCANEISKARIYLPGQRVNANCHNCFNAIQISYMGLKFFNQNLKIPQVKADTQLPGKGTCKHVKLSFKWYRYGCCGRCFSCDDCHIISSVAVHQKLKGITMLCGYCSRQQPTGSICMFCHKQLVKGIDKTGHWQGGMGCRDQAVLSRKDNKKYTGLTKRKQKEK